MSNERFTLTPSRNSMWTVKDSDTGFSIEFRDGLFNETQKVQLQKNVFPDDKEPAVWAAKAMSSIGDYMAQNHPRIVMCDIESRNIVIWMLANEKYWATMASLCKSALMDFEGDEGQYISIAISDAIDLSDQNPAGLTEAERCNLLGSLTLLDDGMANELFNMLSAYWNEYAIHNVSADAWAEEVLWWPAYARAAADKER